MFGAIPIYPYSKPVDGQPNLHKVPIVIGNFVVSYKVDPITFRPTDFRTQIVAINLNVNQKGGPVKLVWDGRVQTPDVRLIFRSWTNNDFNLK